jgi:hypothetical protein
MRYYVYILLDETIEGCYDNEFCKIQYKPFYVGKADSMSKNKKERHLVHYEELDKKIKKITNPHKYNTIKKLKELGFKPNFVIVYRDDDEKKVLEIEAKLIEFYGKSKNGGILTNISDGGVGGNIMKNIDGFQEKLNKINSERWIGENNPNYNRKKEETYSFIFKKENGYHWNKGKIMSEEHKNILKNKRYEKLPLINMICPNTFKVIDTIKTVDAIKKYNLNSVLLYRCLKNGGQHKGFFWKFQGKELLLSKSKRIDYIKPIKIKNKKNIKKIFFKKHKNDDIEISFENLDEASKTIGLNKEVIRRKCIKNNTEDNIFRYENSKYNFHIKQGKKLKISSIDNKGNVKIFESITEAAIYYNANPSAITSVCKGKRKKHKNLIFKYINHD